LPATDGLEFQDLQNLHDLRIMSWLSFNQHINSCEKMLNKMQLHKAQHGIKISQVNLQYQFSKHTHLL